MTQELEIFGGEIAKEGDRVWDLDLDGSRIEGRIFFQIDMWMVHWDADRKGVDMFVLNPLQLHKIHNEDDSIR
jgi:hypothetical protein